MENLYLLAFVFFSCIIFKNNIAKKQKNILKNQFIKFIVLICIFNFLNKLNNNDTKYIGIFLSILFMLLHNKLMYITIDNYMI
jgi:hypothetical protein